MPSYPVQTPDARWAIFSTVVDDFTHTQMTEDECRAEMAGYVTPDDAERLLRIARYEAPAVTRDTGEPSPFLEYCYYGNCVKAIRFRHGAAGAAKSREFCEGPEAGGTDAE